LALKPTGRRLRIGIIGHTVDDDGKGREMHGISMVAGFTAFQARDLSVDKRDIAAALADLGAPERMPQLSIEGYFDMVYDRSWHAGYYSSLDCVLED
jgi:hypothetical protein